MLAALALAASLESSSFCSNAPPMGGLLHDEARVARMHILDHLWRPRAALLDDVAQIAPARTSPLPRAKVASSSPASIK
jgi:hypothetical protein